MGGFERLFKPRGIAVVGAQEDPSRGGGQPLRALRAYGYGGAIHLVNPKRSEIAGMACLLLYATLPLGLYGTVMLLVIAYSYRLSVTTRLSRAALMQIHAELEEASYLSGGDWLATLRRVVLPLLAPALLASFLLLFIIGFREFTLPTILQSESNTVISVIMWQLFAANKIPQAAAVGTLIILFVTPVIFIMRRLLQRQDEGR